MLRKLLASDAGNGGGSTGNQNPDDDEKLKNDKSSKETGSKKPDVEESEDSPTTQQKKPDPQKAEKRLFISRGKKIERERVRQRLIDNDIELEIDPETGEEDIDLTIDKLLEKSKGGKGVDTKKKEKRNSKSDDEDDEDESVSRERRRAEKAESELEQEKINNELLYAIPASEVVKVKSVRAEFLSEFRLRRNKKTKAIEVTNIESGELLLDEDTDKPLPVKKAMENFLKENHHLLLATSKLRTNGKIRGGQTGQGKSSMGEFLDNMMGRG